MKQSMQWILSSLLLLGCGCYCGEAEHDHDPTPDAGVTIRPVAVIDCWQGGSLAPCPERDGGR